MEMTMRLMLKLSYVVNYLANEGMYLQEIFTKCEAENKFIKNNIIWTGSSSHTAIGII